jgi:basic membrane protein A
MRPESGTRRRRWIIGVDRDEGLTSDPSVQPFVLTSMRRRIPRLAYLDLKTAVAGGDTDRISALDLANEGVGLSTTGGHIDHLASELESVRAQIIDGRIDLPRVSAGRDGWWSNQPGEA